MRYTQEQKNKFVEENAAQLRKIIDATNKLRLSYDGGSMLTEEDIDAELPLMMDAVANGFPLREYQFKSAQKIRSNAKSWKERGVEIEDVKQTTNEPRRRQREQPISNEIGNEKLLNFSILKCKNGFILKSSVGENYIFKTDNELIEVLDNAIGLSELEKKEKKEKKFASKKVKASKQKISKVDKDSTELDKSNI